jgi:homoserine O-succinyltransferase
MWPALRRCRKAKGAEVGTGRIVMPLMMDRHPSESCGARPREARPGRRLRQSGDPARAFEIALINNMPDAALAGTERRIVELLNAAARDRVVALRRYSLPGIPRSEQGRQYLSSGYAPIDDLWSRHFDAVIVTGTEPRTVDLRAESYWQCLTEVLDWAAGNVASTVLSCLAAHAAVLHFDGIPRHGLDEKCLGVFDHARVSSHSLTRDLDARLKVPHSRCNEVREDALVSCGYRVLTRSDEAGIDMFAKQRKRSLFVHFQGHPEYGRGVLLSEYKRDIGRFLRGERPVYPSMPRGYFDAAATQALNDFRQQALAQPHPDMLASFPETLAAGPLTNAWRSSAIRIYGNWLGYTAERMADRRGQAGWRRSMVRA